MLAGMALQCTRVEDAGCIPQRVEDLRRGKIPSVSLGATLYSKSKPIRSDAKQAQSKMASAFEDPMQFRIGDCREDPVL